MTPAPTPFHQAVSRRLAMSMIDFVEERGLGQVYYAPIDVVFSQGDVLQPDILYISKEREPIIGEKRIEGPPDLVVEILSPSTAYDDLCRKRRVYLRGGVREYWVVDPAARRVEVFVLDGNTYRAHSEAEEEGAAASSVLCGFSVDVASVFA